MKWKEARKYKCNEFIPAKKRRVVGNKFMVVDKCSRINGEIVAFHCDDNTSVSYFTTSDGYQIVAHWCNLRPLTLLEEWKILKENARKAGAEFTPPKKFRGLGSKFVSDGSSWVDKCTICTLIIDDDSSKPKFVTNDGRLWLNWSEMTPLPKLKIKVGRSYKDTAGNTIRIIKKITDECSKLYYGDNCMIYTKRGAGQKVPDLSEEVCNENS